MEPALFILTSGTLVFLAHLFAVIFSKKRIPDVLMLVFIGIIIGPIFKIIDADKLSTIGNIFGQLTLVTLLFESGTELSFRTLADSIKNTVTLTIINFIVTFAVIGTLGWLVLGMNPGISFMLGAALGGSSSAVAIPLVKQISIGEKSKTILILESAFSAILCIVVALAIFESYKYGEFRIGIIFGQVFSSFLLASLIGLLGSIFWSMVLDKVRTINNSIFTTPAFVFIIYGFNEWLGYSGIISALAFGIGLANMDLLHNRWLRKFTKRRPTLLNPMEKTLFSELVFLMKTFFFVYVGISIKFESLISLLIGLGISVILIILRIPIVRLSLPSDINNVSNKDRAFLSMMIPRGLAAAVLATMISQSGLKGSEGVSNIVFSVIFFSIIFTSVLVPFLEKSERFRRFYIKLLYFPSFGKKAIIDMEENKECYNDKTDTNPETFNKEEDERVSICDDEDDIPNILL
ncbi:MAG: cation:proton antiporter [Bacteroidales bacterium]|nr:cation:proton antiporter [Bacteroidales bacterium]